MKKTIVRLSCVAFVALPASLHADFECGANLLYSWSRPEAEKGEVVTVNQGNVRRRGELEIDAKRKLDDLIARRSSEMKTECQRMHENLAGCIASKFSAKASLLSSLNFSSRKALEDAIAKDCQALQGTCEEIGKFEVSCVEHKTAEAEGEEGEEEGKDSKKKKKK